MHRNLKLLQTAAREGALLLAVLCCCPGASAAELGSCWRGQPGSTYQEWLFNSNSNPTVPDAETNVATGTQITISPGQFSSGWRQQLPGVGSTTGFWDLGRTGTVSLAMPASPATGSRYISIRITQWQDGGIFSQLAAISLPGATLIDRATQAGEPGTVGSWVTDQTLWKMPAGGANEMIVTSAYNGSVIDSVIVETQSREPTCPANMVLAADSGQCNRSNVTWNLPVVEHCLVESVTCNPAPGATLPVGVTEVSCTTTDSYGAAETCRFSVTVTPNADPLLVSIRRLDDPQGSVEVSWPVGCDSHLEWSPEVTDPLAWATYPTPPQASGGRWIVTLTPDEPKRFFRVRQP